MLQDGVHGCDLCCAKMLGVAADVYWNDDSKREDQTKYSGENDRAGTDTLITADCAKFACYLQSVYGKATAKSEPETVDGNMILPPM